MTEFEKKRLERTNAPKNKQDSFFALTREALDLESAHNPQYFREVPAMRVKPSQQYDKMKLCVFCSQFFHCIEDEVSEDSKPVGTCTSIRVACFFHGFISSPPEEGE